MMALFIPGMPCVLCGQPLAALDDRVLFSPFVSNRQDALFKFSDAGVHAACLRQDPLGARARELQEAAIRVAHTPLAQRLCEVCGEPITDPDEFSGWAVLTSDPGSPLSRFNFLRFHRDHFAQWDQYEEFRRLVAAERRAGVWDVPGLDLVGDEHGSPSRIEP